MQQLTPAVVGGERAYKQEKKGKYRAFLVAQW